MFQADPIHVHGAASRSCWRSAYSERLKIALANPGRPPRHGVQGRARWCVDARPSGDALRPRSCEHRQDEPQGMARVCTKNIADGERLYVRIYRELRSGGREAARGVATFASLPSLHRKESARDLGIQPPAGVVETQVRKGIEPRTMRVSSSRDLSRTTNSAPHAARDGRDAERKPA